MPVTAQIASDLPPAAAPGPTPVPRQDLRDAINLLADLTEAYTAAFFLREPDGEYLSAVAWHTLAKSFRGRQPVRMGEGLVGYVAKHRLPVDVDRYQQPSSAYGLYEQDEGIKAFLGFPVGEIGVLVVDTKARQVFTERDKKTVRDFAAFLGHLVMHLETERRERIFGRVLDLLYDVENATQCYADHHSFCAEALAAGRKFSRLGLGMICLLHPNRHQFTVEAVDGPGMATLRGRNYPLQNGLVGWVFRSGRPLSHAHLRPDAGKSYLVAPEEPIRGYNSFIGVPLTAWRRLVGVMAFAGTNEKQLDREEENALQLAGRRVAATLDHYRSRR